MSVHKKIILIKDVFFADSPANCLLKYPAVNPARLYDNAESPMKEPLKISRVSPARNPETIPAICPRIYPR